MAGDGVSVPIRGNNLSFAIFARDLLLAALGSAGPDEYSAWGIDKCVPLALEVIAEKVSKKLRHIVEKASIS